MNHLMSSRSRRMAVVLGVSGLSLGLTLLPLLACAAGPAAAATGRDAGQRQQVAAARTAAGAVPTELAAIRQLKDQAWSAARVGQFDRTNELLSEAAIRSCRALMSRS